MSANNNSFFTTRKMILISAFYLYSKSDTIDSPIMPVTSNTIATNAITGKMNEVSQIAEALDIALRDTQNCLEMDECRHNSLDRKAEGNASIDSRGSTDVIKIQYNTVKMYPLNSSCLMNK